MTSSDNLRLRGLRKGQVMVLVAILATVLIGLAGIAVDLVLVYSVKTFLSTATDSAAMGGMRALERGVTYADQAQEVQRTTKMLFDANFPEGLMMTGNSGKFSQDVVVAGYNMDPTAGAMFENDPNLGPGMREVRILTEAQAPTFFMRLFGVESVRVRAGAYAARRDVNIMVVIDRSSSLVSAGAWGDVQAAAAAFIDQFDNNRDRVGVVSFGTSGNVDYPLSTGFKNSDVAKNKILDQVIPVSAGTNWPVGLWLAYSELLRVNDPAALNSIVFFTDGQPSAFSATFRMKTGSTGPRCLTNTEQGTIAAAQSSTSAQFLEIMGFWDRRASPPPVALVTAPFDCPVNPRCFNLATSSSDNYGNNVELAFDSGQPWPAVWTATEPGSISKTFCIQSGASGCEGDAADFTYSRTDSRLFNNSSTTSDRNFRGTNVHNAAKNLALNIAQVARRDASLGYVNIHSIGMGGWGYPADHGLMKRVANDPSNSYGALVTTAADEPHGTYIYAPSKAELQSAFDKVRSEVMRLTR